MISNSAGAPGSTSASRIGIVSDPSALLAPLTPEMSAFMAAAVDAIERGEPVPAPPPDFAQNYATWQQQRLLQDFFGRCRYQEENAKLTATSAHRIVFFGDSITESWRDPELFSGDVVNRGISGQTTAQMIGRFRQDVIALGPRVVHILAGTNDIAGNTGATTLTWIKENFRTMVDIAKLHEVRIVLASVLPAARYGWSPGNRADRTHSRPERVALRFCPI